MPRWLAEAVTVPLAAQIACTPLLAALFGQVSLVAVLANILAAPAVGPATVLGLLGGLVAIPSLVLGQLVALPAAWCARWIVGVARWGSGLPHPSGSVPAGVVGVLVATVVCAAIIVVLPAILTRRTRALLVTAAMASAVLVPMPTFGWPPPGWLLVACDVGQGDGLVLNAGGSRAVVVDAGPDPAVMRRCLDGLGVHAVPLVVLTHFHADHVDGLAGVLHGRRVGAIEVTPYADPAVAAAKVRRIAAGAGVPVVTARPGEVRAVGPLRWQVLAPLAPAPASSESPPNDDSVVLFVRTHGVAMLLLGDEEPGSQQRLHAAYPQLQATVLKVAHHGSAKQDPDLVRSLGARVGLISVGADNDYGHPAPSLLALLRDARIEVHRTDREGSLAVVGGPGGIAVRRR